MSEEGEEMYRRQISYWLFAIVVSLLAVSVGHAAPICPQDPRAENAPTSPKYQIELDNLSTWQGPGGTIMFTVIGLDPQKSISIEACLRPFDATTGWKESDVLEPVRVVQPAGTTGTKFSVSIPWSSKKIRYFGWSFYTPAHLRVVVSETSASVPAPAPVLDVVREIRISPIWFAVLAAVVFVGFVTWALYSFALFLGVPGTSVILRIISTGSGWASLAQFQIILWTLVIGAGAVYVMTLRGTLIDISVGTLGLLGIAGAAAVGSQLKSSQQAEPSPALAPPGPITGLVIVGVPSPSEVTLSWTAPSSGGAPSAYMVQFQPAGAAGWFTASTTLTKTRFMLVGLTPGTNYNVQVFATNAAGISTPLATPVTTPAAPAAPPGPAVVGLRRHGDVTGTSIDLRWPTQAGATYTVEYRAHDSDQPWRVFRAGINASQVTVSPLRATTAYDFRVFATSAAGVAGPPSDTLTETTGPRVPKWSDIVTDTDRPAEIDVTRAQMLFFTIISAFFVAQSIAFSGAIPEIPTSYVTLMGISNGVYLTKKFAAG
jgi:hypothetical protein